MPRPALLPVLLLALSPVLLGGCGEPEDTRPGQPVKTRRAAFSAILKSFEPMGKQLRDGRYDADRFLAHAQKLDELKDAPWAHFGPDTLYPPSKAKASVWQDSERFAAERERFLKATTELARVAGERNEKKAAAAYDAVHDSCRSCHKAFKD